MHAQITWALQNHPNVDSRVSKNFCFLSCVQAACAEALELLLKAGHPVDETVDQEALEQDLEDLEKNVPYESLFSERASELLGHATKGRLHVRVQSLRLIPRHHHSDGSGIQIAVMDRESKSLVCDV